MLSNFWTYTFIQENDMYWVIYDSLHLFAYVCIYTCNYTFFFPPKNLKAAYDKNLKYSEILKQSFKLKMDSNNEVG